jgi:hypothetical protein
MIHSSEISVHIRTTILEDGKINNYHYENLKSHINNDMFIFK